MVSVPLGGQGAKTEATCATGGVSPQQGTWLNQRVASGVGGATKNAKKLVGKLWKI